jgi:hypothetical protein
MKNIHILPTDKPSRLRIGSNFNFVLGLTQSAIVSKNDSYTNQHIYITSDEEIKEGDWFYDGDGELCKYTSDYVVNPNGWNDNKKIILTTDQDLDGVQAIDDEFLEWFVENPTCEYVTTYDGLLGEPRIWKKYIIIPKEKQKQHLIDIMRGDEELGLYEEPKQETLEEAAERLSERHHYAFGQQSEFYQLGFTEGAKWQQERMYSKEDLRAAWMAAKNSSDFNEWFKQFKK